MSSDDRSLLEMALSVDMDPDTSGPLTPERRTEIEQKIETLKQQEQPSDAERARGNGFTADQAHGVTTGTVDGTVGAQSVPQNPPTAPGPQPGQQDVAALVQQEVAKLLGGGGIPQAPQAVQMTFEDVLKQIDPRDSDASLAMLAWLEANHRISAIATLNGGGGYLFHYSEPKGSSKEGYTPGATQGGRMVDTAVDNARASGAKPRVIGMCGQCMSAVVQHDDGSVTLDGEPGVENYAGHDDGSPHTFVG